MIHHVFYWRASNETSLLATLTFWLFLEVFHLLSVCMIYLLHIIRRIFCYFFMIFLEKASRILNYSIILVVVCAISSSHFEVIGREKRSTIVWRVFTLIRRRKLIVLVMPLFFGTLLITSHRIYTRDSDMPGSINFWGHWYSNWPGCHKSVWIDW